jgi:hypothetical protein
LSKINTVTISLTRYNELRDFEKNIKENKFVIRHNESYYFKSHYEYFSKEEFESELSKEFESVIENLRYSEDEYKQEIRELKLALSKEENKRRNWWNK